jgi:hypothetical protein
VVVLAGHEEEGVVGAEMAKSYFFQKTAIEMAFGTLVDSADLH